MNAVDSSIKKTVSLLSYDQDKLEAEERILRRKRSIPGFLLWQTRRNSMQAYMCVTLNVTNMLQFCGALIMYGGVVWVSYLTWAVIVGVPMITAEMALGHYINNEIKYVWRMCRIAKGILWNCLVSTFAIATLCHVYLVILFHFSFQPHDFKVNEYGLTDLRNCLNKSSRTFNIQSGDYCELDGSYFALTNDIAYEQKFLYIPKQNLWVPTLYLAAICFLMVLINCKGIRSVEKVTIFFLLVPYLCAVILAMMIFTLPGALGFIRRCWFLDWDMLKEVSVWLISFRTMVKAFSIGSLSLIFVSVHSDYRDDIMIDVIILFLNIVLNNVLYTIIILGLVGIIDSTITMSQTSTNYLDYVTILLRVIKGLTELPPPGWLWKFLFYSYLIGSAIAQQTLMVAAVADVITSLVPKFKTNKFYVTTSLCIVFFLLGICIFAMEVVKTPTLDSSFVTIGLLQSITIFWIYNYERVCADFHFLMGYKPSLFYQFTWVISPILFFGVIIIEIFTEKAIGFPNKIHIYLTILHIFIYVLSAFIEAYLIWRRGENTNIFRAEKSWGPTDPLLKESRIIFKSRIITKEHIYRQKLYEEQLIKPADLTDQDIIQLL